MARGGEKNVVLIILAFVIGLPLLILFELWPIILFVIGIVVLVVFMRTRAQKGETKNIKSVVSVDMPKQPSVGKSEICAGTYIFGEDIPTGKYDLVAVRGGG